MDKVVVGRVSMLKIDDKQDKKKSTTKRDFLSMTKPSEILVNLFDIDENEESFSITSKSISKKSVSSSSRNGSENEKDVVKPLLVKPLSTVKKILPSEQRKTSKPEFITRNKTMIKKQSNIVNLLKRESKEINIIKDKLKTNDEKDVFFMLRQKMNNLYMQNRVRSINLSDKQLTNAS